MQNLLTLRFRAARDSRPKHRETRYSILKFQWCNGGEFYQVRLKKGWFGTWLKDAQGHVRRFLTKQEAHSAAGTVIAPSRVATPEVPRAGREEPSPS